MAELYAQGDVLLERVADTPVSGQTIRPDSDGAAVLARGEVTGHRHAVHGGSVAMYRDDALARDIPPELYVCHIKIGGAAPAELRHEEHDTISLRPGTYRVRRQREFDRAAVHVARVVED
jgi:hypothetical protein